MKIEISVKEQNGIIDILEDNPSVDLGIFLNRLYKVREKRTKVYNDKVEFAIGDVVKLIKYVSDQSGVGGGIRVPYIIIYILKDSKGRIYYGVYGPTNINDQFEVYLDDLNANKDESDGYEFCWEYRGHCLEKFDKVSKALLKKMKILFDNTKVKKSKFIAHIKDI